MRGIGLAQPAKKRSAAHVPRRVVLHTAVYESNAKLPLGSAEMEDFQELWPEAEQIPDDVIPLSFSLPHG